MPGFASAGLLDALRNTSAVLRAGASVVPLDSDRQSVMKVSADPTVAETSEGGTTAATTNNFVAVPFAPAVLRGVVAVSRELLQDTIAADVSIEESITDSMGRSLDSYVVGAINGTSGILSVAAGGALASYDKLVDAAYQLASNNGKLSAFVMNPREVSTLAKLKDANDQPLNAPALIAAVPQYGCTSISTTGGGGTESIAYAGDWSKLVVGVRAVVELQLLAERYAEEHRVGVAYSVRLDALLSRPKSMCRITGITA